MKRLPVSQLQNDLNYEFRHIIFLEEALTHSLTDSNNQGEYPESLISFKRRTNSRLKLVGESVLKSVALEYAINAITDPEKCCDESMLISLCDSLLSQDTLEMIGDDLELEHFVVVNEEDRKAENFDEEELFPGIISAIFGAIYIDSQMGSSRNGFTKCYGIFFWLWRSYISADESVEKQLLKHVRLVDSSKKFFNAPPSKVNLIQVLKADMPEELFNGGGFLQTLEGVSLCYKFKQPHLVFEALTDNSIREKYPELENVRDMKSLQLVGKAVYRLSIAEYLFWHYVSENGSEQEMLTSELIDKFTCDKYLNLMSVGFGLSCFVLVTKELRSPFLHGVRNMHEFMEAIIGAIYVDSKQECGFSKIGAMIWRNAEMLGIFAKPVLGYCIPIGVKRKTRAYDSKAIPEDVIPSMQYHNVTIPDLDRFLQNWQEFNETPEQHIANFQGALDLEWNIKRKVQKDYLHEYTYHLLRKECTEAFCNSLEFERVSVYNIAARLHIAQGKGNKVKINISSLTKNITKRKKRDWLGFERNSDEDKESDNEIPDGSVITVPFSEVSRSPSSASIRLNVWLHKFQHHLYKYPAIEWLLVGLLASLFFSLMVWIKSPFK